MSVGFFEARHSSAGRAGSLLPYVFGVVSKFNRPRRRPRPRNRAFFPQNPTGVDTPPGPHFKERLRGRRRGRGRLEPHDTLNSYPLPAADRPNEWASLAERLRSPVASAAARTECGPYPKVLSIRQARLWALRLLVLPCCLALPHRSLAQCCPPIINNQPQSQTVTQGVTAAFTVVVSSGTFLTYQWRFNGNNLLGATNSSLQLTNVQAWQQGGYSVAVTNAAGSVISANALLTVLVRPGFIVGWGHGDQGQTTTPAGLTNVLAIAGGADHSLALKTDRTVAAWGANSFGQASVPPWATNVAAIAAGDAHSIALRRDGSVVVWGDNTWGQLNLPPGLTNVMAVAAGAAHNLALKSDGTVIGWGYNGDGQADVPPGLANVVAIAAGSFHSTALTVDGTLVGWGDDLYNQSDTPPGLTNAISLAAGQEHNLALRADGTVMAWGGNYVGQSDVPPGLSNVVAVTAGRNHSVALIRDGTLVVWGDTSFGQNNVPPALTNAIAISSNGDHTVAIAGSGAVSITLQPRSQQVATGTNVNFVVMATGKSPLGYRWRLNGNIIPGATDSIYTRFNVGAPDAGTYSVVVSNSFGSVISSNATLFLKAGIAIRLVAPAFGANGFQFQLTGPAGSYVIEASSDLSNWTAIATTNIPNGTVYFTDPYVFNIPLRFYRAYSQ